MYKIHLQLLCKSTTGGRMKKKYCRLHIHSTNDSI